MIFKFSVSKKIYQLNLDFVSSTINKKLFLLIIKNYEIVKILILNFIHLQSI